MNAKMQCSLLFNWNMPVKSIIFIFPIFRNVLRYYCISVKDAFVISEYGKVLLFHSQEMISLLMLILI